MSENNEKNVDNQNSTPKDESKENVKDLPVEKKLKETEDKLLRSLAEIENQRRRFEKEIKDALNLDLLILLKKA